MAVFGFVGTGLMGGGMVGQLLAKGHKVRVIAHRNREPIERAVARGAEEVKEFGPLVIGADAVFLCLPSSAEVRETVDALMPHLAAGQTVIDTTTADPEATQAIARELKGKKVDFADAPVTRGAQDAEAGKLLSWVGALKRVFKRIEPWIACYSEKIEHLGPVGAGHTAKLINNFMTVGYVAMIAAATKAGRAADIDLAKMFGLMMMGGARSGIMERLVPPMLQGDYSQFKFSIANAAKDVRYARALMLSLRVDTDIANALVQDFEAALDRGMGDALVGELLKS